MLSNNSTLVRMSREMSCELVTWRRASFETIRQFPFVELVRCCDWNCTQNTCTTTSNALGKQVFGASARSETGTRYLPSYYLRYKISYIRLCYYSIPGFCLVTWFCDFFNKLLSIDSVRAVVSGVVYVISFRHCRRPKYLWFPSLNSLLWTGYKV